MKAYTDLEQSKKLEEILPLESADMYYDYDFQKHECCAMIMDEQFDDTLVRAWSLAALLDALPEKYTELIKEGSMYRIIIKDSYLTCLFDNPVDACVAMILKLYELKLL